jgi:hypothetical protein
LLLQVVQASLNIQNLKILKRHRMWEPEQVHLHNSDIQAYLQTGQLAFFRRELETLLEQSGLWIFQLFRLYSHGA